MHIFCSIPSSADDLGYEWYFISTLLKIIQILTVNNFFLMTPTLQILYTYIDIY